MKSLRYIIMSIGLLLITACEWGLGSWGIGTGTHGIAVERYDRVQSLYLTTGDFSALQQMNINYPMQTRTLIEDVLHIGQVNDPEINSKFLRFYQDTTLQNLISESERQYATMDDINEGFAVAFENLVKLLPNIELPTIYAQIGSLSQSIIVGNGMIGICLDKYLGSNYPLYLKPAYGYTPEQRKMMDRQYIVPDGISFYLLSLYPLPADLKATQFERDMHMGRIQWVVNSVVGRNVFNNQYVHRTDRYMKRNKKVAVDLLLCDTDYQKFW